jgi:hypothetical protein
MDTKDLRIGNMLYADGEIATVVGIDGEDENNFVIKLDHGNDKVIQVKPSVIDIKPIPLGDDFVKELGLFDDLGNLKFSNKTEKYKLRRANGHVVLLNDKNETMVHFWDVKYLHRLQNLYYILSKQELEINW